MRISDLSARTGVSTSTLRYYDAEGLVPADRAENGYRVYGEAAVDRLAFIAQAKRLDLRLAAARDLAAAWASEPCRGVRATYRRLLVERATRVAERIVALETLRATLAVALGRLDALPDRDEPCDPACSFLDRPRVGLPVAGVKSAPIACSLGGGDYEARIADWHDLLADAPRADVPGGVRVTLAASTLDRATALAAAEQRCCEFYAFRIDLRGSTFELTITAPREARTMLDDLLPVEVLR